MSEVNAGMLRQAILDKNVWQDVDNGRHFPNADFIHKGYVQIIEQEHDLTPDNLAPEVRERLGLEGGERDHVKLSLFRKLIKNGDFVYLADSGEDAMIARFDREPRLSRDEEGKMVIDGRWISADYFLSPVEIQDGTIPHTSVRVEVNDPTEGWRAILSSNFMENLYTSAVVDPETDDPDVEGLMKSLDSDATLIEFAQQDPEAAQEGVIEHAVNSGLTEFREMAPITTEEILGISGIVRVMRAGQTF